jgi:diaminohydroxyphosphoribosylaminopyrimidine deaminase/5-amino-6-(5-phosphoribosylamino)uracil reductase
MGFVNPNPLVGAVIVLDGLIIGEGYHEYFGGPHAEINALRNTKRSVKGATLYVTLEPCSHTGKTPPCTDAIIESGISKVVAGIEDPNPLVSGKGFNALREAGIEVHTGVLKEEILKLNEIFLHYIRTKLPFCTIKTAMTLDGKTAAVSGDSKWISSVESRNYVHDLRHRYSSILTGVETIIADDPELTDRSAWKKQSNPVRIIADTSARIPLHSKVLTDNKAPAILATTRKADPGIIKQIEKLGCGIIICPLDNDKLDLSFLLAKLGEMGIDSILVESGGELAFSLISGKLVSNMYTFIAPKIIGGKTAGTPVGGKGFDLMSQAMEVEITSYGKIGKDILIETCFKY